MFFVGLALIIILVLGAAIYFIGRRVFPVPLEKSGKSDAIVVVGHVSGRSGGRHLVVKELVNAALPLYKKKPNAVILCGPVIASALKEAGVPESSVLPLPAAKNVCQSLAEAKTVLVEKGGSSAAIVATPWEIREAGFYAKELGLSFSAVKAKAPILYPSSVVAALFVFVFAGMFGHIIGGKFRKKQ